MNRLGTLISSLAVGSLLLAGCTMGPDYKRPDVVVPDAFEYSINDGKSIANLNWWELFGDEQLNALITTALEQNKDMAIAISRIEEARAALGFVRSDQYPQFEIVGGAERGSGLAIGGVQLPVRNNFVLAGNLSFELDLWGKLRRSTESAQADLLATIDASNSVMITLIADVASAYLLLLDLDEQVAIAERTLETRTQSLGIIKARFEYGTVALLDVNQAEIEMYDAQAQLAAFQRQDAQAENLLNILLGQNPGDINRSGTKISSLKPLAIPVGLPSELLERRPDIRVAEQQLAAQTALIGVAEAIRFPSLNLTGSLGLASDDLSGFLSSDNQTWGLSAGLLAPIYNAGRNKRRVEVETARTEQALLNYQQTVLQALREVEDSIVAVETYARESASRKQQRLAAASATKLSWARYDAGVTSYLEVLESERSLFRSELSASSTHREQLIAYITLYKALGGGWNL
jgi:multidrug efflux system outer membrane protein